MDTEHIELIAGEPKREPRSRSRLDGHARRQEIIHAAIRTFARHGFRGATIRRLAHAARISEALVYRYFPSKKDLYDAVLDTLMESSAGILAAEPESAARTLGDRDFLANLARQIHHHYTAHPEELRLLFFSALQGHSLASDFFERQGRRCYELLISRIREMQERGRCRKVDPAIAARAFLGMVSYHVMVQAMFEDKILPGRAERPLEEFADLFLEGILP